MDSRGRLAGGSGRADPDGDRSGDERGAARPTALPADLDMVDDDGKPELVDADLAAEEVGCDPAF